MARRSNIPKSELKDKIIPITKDILKIAGVCLAVGGVMMIPSTAVIATPVVKYIDKKIKEHEEIKNTKFDKVRLWIILRRLEKQKVIKLIPLSDGYTKIELTDDGITRVYKYRLEDLPKEFTKKKWDGKWRVITFDIPEQRRGNRDHFRRMLNTMKFYKLQKSVYLCPYPCEDEITYLREYYGFSQNVQILVVGQLENDDAYKKYFGLV